MYRIKEYIDWEGDRMFKAQRKVLGIFWLGDSTTLSFSYTSCRDKLCKKLRGEAETPRYHEVDCDDSK